MQDDGAPTLRPAPNPISAGALLSAFVKAKGSFYPKRLPKGGTADAIREEGMDLLSPLERAAVETRIAAFIAAGAPEALSATIGALRPLTAVSDVADMARSAGWELLPTSRIYHQTGTILQFDRLRAAAGSLSVRDDYERQAVRQLIEDFLTEQASIARSVMASTARDTGRRTATDAQDAVQAWSRARWALADAATRLVENIEAGGGGWSFAKLTIVNGAMRQLAATA